MTRHRREARDRRHAAHREGQAENHEAGTLLLTSARPVDLVVTELGVIGFPAGARRSSRLRPRMVGQVREATEAELAVPARVPEMALG